MLVCSLQLPAHKELPIVFEPAVVMVALSGGKRGEAGACLQRAHFLLLVPNGPFTSQCHLRWETKFPTHGPFKDIRDSKHNSGDKQTNKINNKTLSGRGKRPGKFCAWVLHQMQQLLKEKMIVIPHYPHLICWIMNFWTKGDYIPLT